MIDKSIEKLVNSLIQMDIDAAFAYETAIKCIKEEDIKISLSAFLEDHEAHIDNLSNFLEKHGGKPIKRSQDIKGYIIEGMTSLRGVTGTQGALKAMLSNEKLTNKKYSEALENEELSKELRRIIDSNYQDEKRHYEYIDKKLNE